MWNAGWVALGGALGAVARYGVSLALQRTSASSTFPSATLAVNVAGCLAAGAALAFFERQATEASTRLFVMTGLLGGFTTFSAFSVETLALHREGRPMLAALNAGLNLALGLAAAHLGWRLAARG